MKSTKITKILLIILIILTNIGCDQVSKKVVRTNISSYEKIAVIKDHFTLTRVENTGAFLSIGSDLGNHTKNLLLSFIPLLVIGAGIGYVFLKKNLSIVNITGLCFVIGGGIGNIYDRIVHGSVTDFMHIDFGLFQTGIFNMADLSIMTGAFIIILGQLLKRKKNEIGTADTSIPDNKNI